MGFTSRSSVGLSSVLSSGNHTTYAFRCTLTRGSLLSSNKWWDLQNSHQKLSCTYKAYRSYEDEFPSTNRLEINVSSDTEQPEIAHLESTEVSVSLTNSSSSKGCAGSGDCSVRSTIQDTENENLYQVTYVQVKPSSFGAEEDGRFDHEPDDVGDDDVEARKFNHVASVIFL